MEDKITCFQSSSYFLNILLVISAHNDDQYEVKCNDQGDGQKHVYILQELFAKVIKDS